MGDFVSASLRDCVEEDLFRLAAVEKRIQKAPWNIEGFRAELHKSQSRVLLVTDDATDEQVLAYLVYWVLDGEGAILNIGVDLPHRRMGYAKLLLRECINDSMRREASRILLEVRVSNQPAIELYQRFQFSIIHLRRSFYPDGEDAYQMELYLDGRLNRF